MECTDPTPGPHYTTYIALYALAAVLALCGILLLAAPMARPPPFSRVWFRMFWPGHLLLGAVGYALEGVAKERYAGQESTGILVAARLLIALSMDPLIGVFFCIGEGLLPDSPALWSRLWVLSGLFVLGSLVAVGVTTALAVRAFDTIIIVVGLVTLAATITWGAACARRPSPAGVVKTAAGSVILVALAILAALEPRCGDAGYADCFARCPFPVHFRSWPVYACIVAVAYLSLSVAQLVEADLVVAPRFFAFLGLEGAAKEETTA